MQVSDRHTKASVVRCWHCGHGEAFIGDADDGGMPSPHWPGCADNFLWWVGMKQPTEGDHIQL